MAKQTSYQITVFGPSVQIDGPFRGSEQHNVVVCAYVDTYDETVETLRERVRKALQVKYNVGFGSETVDSCAYELSKAVLEPGAVVAPSVTQYYKFANLCAEIFQDMKVKRLEAEKAELLKADTELAAKIRKVDEELAQVRKQ